MDVAPPPLTGPEEERLGMHLRRVGDYEGAARAFERAHFLGSAVAAFELGVAYCAGELTLRENFVRWRFFALLVAVANNTLQARGMELLLASAQGGYGPAMAEAAKGLADMIYVGNFALGDNNAFDAVHEWGTRAVESGDTYAMAVCTLHGLGGLGADGDRAEALFRASADAGFAHAMQTLGLIYQRHMDYVNAMEWYLKAAQFGLGTSLYRIGYILFKGKLDGIADEMRALPYLSRASRHGIAYARRRISRTVFRVDLPVMDWALGAQSLTPRGCMLSRRDNLLLHQRLSLEDPTLETRFPDERLRELYVYGRAFYNDSTLYEEDVEAPLQELPVRVYVDTIGRARTALVTLLGLQRRRNAASLIGLLPRDLARMVAAMVWQTRVTPHLWGVQLEQKPRRSSRIRKKRK